MVAGFWAVRIPAFCFDDVFGDDISSCTWVEYTVGGVHRDIPRPDGTWQFGAHLVKWEDVFSFLRYTYLIIRGLAQSMNLFFTFLFVRRIFHFLWEILWRNSVVAFSIFARIVLIVFVVMWRSWENAFLFIREIFSSPGISRGGNGSTHSLLIRRNFLTVWNLFWQI